MSATDEPAAAPVGVPHPRAIRSFVTRAGRTTIGQARALAELGPRYRLPFDPGQRDLVAACVAAAEAEGRHYTRTVLEIGFGAGANIPFFRAIKVDYSGIEGSPTIRETVARNYPELAGKLYVGDFLSYGFPERYGIIVDRASMTHNSTSAIRRRASASLSFTPSSMTYSKVMKSRGARVR